MGIFFSFLAWGALSAQDLPEDYVQQHSKKVEEKIVPSLEKRFPELLNKTPDTKKVHFSKGYIFLNKEGLVWEDTSTQTTLLVPNAGLAEGYSVSGFKISPDA